MMSEEEIREFVGRRLLGDHSTVVEAIAKRWVEDRKEATTSAYIDGHNDGHRRVHGD